MKRVALALPWLLAALHSVAWARGVSPYLPLNLEPEAERDIERVLILADKPVLTRPIAAATVLDALPKACRTDPQLCERVRRYLDRYMRTLAVTHASIEGAATSGANTIIPNEHGEGARSDRDLSLEAYYQPNDYLLVNVGGVSYEGRTVATGSMISAGWSWAQLDVGFRDHWLSPMTDSSALLSTEAPTLPSLTLSNYEPLTRLGLQYEFFLARMSKIDDIATAKGPESGTPRLAGMVVMIEPVSGWAIGVNRLLEYGGAGRSESLHEVLNAFLDPAHTDNAAAGAPAYTGFGKQVASITSRFLFPVRTPFAVYFEYAGNDTTRGTNYLLGDTTTSAGIDFPRLWHRFDLTYEVSEWQDAWYTSTLYPDVLTNDGIVIGQWYGDQRKPRDGVGGHSQMLRLGWHPEFGGQFEMQLRSIANASYTGAGYTQGYDATYRYSRPWREMTVGAEALLGRDVFGQDFKRVGLFARYAPNAGGDDGSYSESDEDDAHDGDAGAAIFIDTGVNASRTLINVQDGVPLVYTQPRIEPHLAVGARRAVSEHSDLGTRVEFDNVDGHSFVGVRALDYRYRFAGPLALGLFLGAARYDVATPAYGAYAGVGAALRDLVPDWDIGVEYRDAIKMRRDHVLPSDPAGPRQDSFYDIRGVTLYVSRHF